MEPSVAQWGQYSAGTFRAHEATTFAGMRLDFTYDNRIAYLE
jgi:hypothetical protein